MADREDPHVAADAGAAAARQTEPQGPIDPPTGCQASRRISV